MEDLAVATGVAHEGMKNANKGMQMRSRDIENNRPDIPRGNEYSANGLH
jgi:hypothetical protein